jgi:hypothetical protein
MTNEERDRYWESLPDRLGDFMPDGSLTWADAVGGVKGREAGTEIIEQAMYETIHEYLIGREAITDAASK